MRNVLFFGLALLASVGAVAPMSPAAAQQAGGISVDRHHDSDGGYDNGRHGSDWKWSNRDRDDRHHRDDWDKGYDNRRHDGDVGHRGDGNHDNGRWSQYGSNGNGRSDYGSAGGKSWPVRIRPL